VYHEYFPSDGNVGKIVICGGGADLKGLIEFLAQELNVDVEICNPFTNIILQKPEFLPQKKSLSFVTVLGLAMRKNNDKY
jgi:Tfp pilus assembly PilM family ATPase